MRLDKYLAETAQCPRSEAKALLAKGRVTVNGAVCKKGDTQLKEDAAVAPPIVRIVVSHDEDEAEAAKN